MKKKILIIVFVLIAISAQGQKQEANQEQLLKYQIDHLEGILEGKNSTKGLTKEDFIKGVKSLKNTFSVDIKANGVSFYYTEKYLSYKWFSKVIGLSAYYFPLFEKKLAQYEMPLELKYLAIVESALNPRAESPAGARGLWQFMPETGQSMGLKENEQINIFFDPVANTDSAVRYLKKLNERFNGDWLLAISAYNCGAGNVDKAIKKAKSTDYWQLRKYLPKETQAYVPAYFAVSYVFHFYADYGIEPPNFKYKFTDFKMVKTNKGMTLQEITKAYKTPLNVLRFANPQILTDYIPKGSIVYVFN